MRLEVAEATGKAGKLLPLYWNTDFTRRPRDTDIFLLWRIAPDLPSSSCQRRTARYSCTSLCLTTRPFSTDTERRRSCLCDIVNRAAEWGVDPSKIGMIGFSAGAGLTMHATLHSKTMKGWPLSVPTMEAWDR